MPPFLPSPDAASKVLDDLTSIHYSLEQVAQFHNVSTDDLLAWLARPDIAERLASHTSAAAARTRLVAACNMTQAVNAIVFSLTSYTQAERDDALQPSLQTFLFEEARRVNARRAAATLLRLARYFPALVAPTPPAPRDPRPAPTTTETHDAPPPRAPRPPLQLTTLPTLATSSAPPAATPKPNPPQQSHAPHLRFADLRFADLSPTVSSSHPAPPAQTNHATPSAEPAPSSPDLRFADLSFAALSSPARPAPSTAARPP